MLLQLIILAISFFVLIKGADTFVESASAVAKCLNVPDILIGLTIVAFGTSAPEASVSIKAVLAGNSDMVLGNIIGSNILNILLILGISSIIAPIRVQNNTIKKEIPFLFLVSLLMSVLLMDTTLGEGVMNMISRSDGIVILIFFSVFVYYLVTLAKNGQSEEIEAKYPLKQAILYTILGLVAIVIGGNYVVDSATHIAVYLGVEQKFIALTIVALGTSLPELVTSVVAARKGKQDLAIGNVIGSNIFNICFVAGFPAAFLGNIIPSNSVTIDLMVMIFATIMLFFFSYSNKRISKVEGISFLVIFILYYGYLVVSQLGVI